MKMSMEYPCIYFEKNGRCRKFSGDTVISYCVMGPCQEQKLSNADRIRAMTDEELAREINLMFKCDPDWQRKFLNWLKQPAEEDT